MNQTTTLSTELSELGVRVQNRWLQSLLDYLAKKHSTGANTTPQLVMQYLVASDIRESTTSEGAAPYIVSEQHNVRIENTMLLQIVRVREIGISIVNQLEYLNDLEELKKLKGQKVIRLVHDESGDEEQNDDDGLTEAQDAVQKGSELKKMCRLILEDSNGQRFWGLERKPIKGIQLSTKLGTKLLVKNVLVRRGVLMLDPNNTTILGGSIEEWDKDYFPKRLIEELKGELSKTKA